MPWKSRGSVALRVAGDRRACARLSTLGGRPLPRRSAFQRTERCAPPLAASVSCANPCHLRRRFRHGARYRDHAEGGATRGTEGRANTAAFGLEGAVIDVGPIQSSRCPDSRIAQARLLVLPTPVAEGVPMQSTARGRARCEFRPFRKSGRRREGPARRPHSRRTGAQWFIGATRARRLAAVEPSRRVLAGGCRCCGEVSPQGRSVRRRV